MQYPVKVDSIEREITRIVVSGQRSYPSDGVSNSTQNLLRDIAAKIGEFFQAEACIILTELEASPLRSAFADGENLSKSASQNGATTDNNFKFAYRAIDWWQEEIPPEDRQRLLAALSQLRFEVTTEENSSLKLLADAIAETLPSQICLATLTHLDGKINGAVLLLKPQSASWSNPERESLEQLADLMAIVISQLRLKQQAQTKTRFQAVLNHLSNEIDRDSAPEAFFRTCLLEIGNALQISRASILKLKYQNPLQKRGRQKIVRGRVIITCQWSANKSVSCPQQYSFDLQDSQLCQQALQQAPQNLVFSERTASDSPEPLENEFKLSSSALLMLPLTSKTSSDAKTKLVLGFLVLQHDSPRYWTDDELDLLDWIGVQIATVMIHHQTLNRVKSIVEERTAQLTHALEFQAKLTEKMRQQIEQLQQLNQLKDDFLSSMSHELKTPLTSMKMAIKMLRQEQLPPAMQQRYLAILEQEWNREYDLIKDLLTLQQVESGELTLTPQELNLRSILEPLAEAFGDKWQTDKGLTIKLDLPNSALSLYTDADSLQHILKELLTNAGKYSAPDTTVEFSARSERDRHCLLTVANYGAAIAAEELPYIFDKFRRGKGVTDRAVQGTGLGLALVKYLVDHLDGTIEVTSEPVAKSSLFLTTFTVKLPNSTSIKSL